MTARLSTRTIICQVSERKELKRKGGPEEVRVGSKRRQGRRPALEPKGCLPRRGIPNTGLATEGSADGKTTRPKSLWAAAGKNAATIKGGASQVGARANMSVPTLP